MKLNEFINDNIKENTFNCKLDIFLKDYNKWWSYRTLEFVEISDISIKKKELFAFLDKELSLSNIYLKEDTEFIIYFGFENLSDSPSNVLVPTSYYGDCYKFKLSEYHSYREKTK